MRAIRPLASIASRRAPPPAIMWLATGDAMGEIDGVGEIVTGGLMAGAVEPATGGVGRSASGACLNCGTLLSGTYCSACGQKARVHRSLRTFFGDLVQGAFNFEGKIWRTLPMLAWRPGEMTRRYVEGERARFVSPVALYLFTVFAMFAVLNFTGAIGLKAPPIGVDLRNMADDERSALNQLEAERAVAGKASRRADIVDLDRRIAAQKQDVAQIEAMQAGAPIKFDGTEEADAPEWLKAAGQNIQRDPQMFVRNAQDAASKYSWALIPLSVPFLWLLFPFNRRYHLYDHTVFVTYSISFMMMLAIAAGLLVSAGWIPIASLLIFLPPIHIYRQLRGAYRLGRISALLRTTLLVTFACVVSFLFVGLVFAIGAL